MGNTMARGRMRYSREVDSGERRMYRERDLVQIAKRQNNTRRSYLVVNRLQGKHIPVRPSQALELFDGLAQIVQEKYGDEDLLLVGFAETATAIGASLAACLGCDYMQTTRETLEGVEYLYFSESHSHATQQKLARDDIEKVRDLGKRIVFVEDEVTTGNTIWKIIQILRREYPGSFQFAVASLLNGMGAQDMERYQQGGVPLHFLVKTDHSVYGEAAAKFQEDGDVLDCVCDGEEKIVWTVVGGGCQPRRLVSGGQMQARCRRLWKETRAKFPLKCGSRVLVLGTEEFMYPGLCVAAGMEAQGCQVSYHATTRSPIAVCKDEEYPLHRQYVLRSFYDPERVTYLYDLGSYDQVFVITDGLDLTGIGGRSLSKALKLAGNTEIHFIRWESL